MGADIKEMIGAMAGLAARRKPVEVKKIEKTVYKRIRRKGLGGDAVGSAIE